MKKEINLNALKKAKNDLNKETERLASLLKQKESLDAKIAKQRSLIADKTEARQSEELKLFGDLATAAGLSIFSIVSAMQSGNFNSVTDKLKNSGIDKNVLNEIFELMKEQPKKDDKDSKKTADEAADKKDEADGKEDNEEDENAEDKSVPSSNPAPAPYNNHYQG